MATRKPKLPKLQAVHRVYGECLLIERRETDSGDVMIVQFADKTERALLAHPKFWITPLPESKAIRVKPEEPEHDDELALSVATRLNRTDEIDGDDNRDDPE
jgi:hypothetical protein